MAIYRATKWRRYGSIPACLPLGACDIGEAILEDGRKVFITWGSRAEDWDATRRANYTGDLVLCGASTECLLPTDETPYDENMKRLLSVVPVHLGGWCYC